MSSSCIAIVDPISTGATLAAEAASRGYDVIAVYSMELTPDIRAMVPVKVEYLAEVEEQATIKETAYALTQACGSSELVSVIVGAESGVTVADALSEELGLRTNGTSLGARRNKNVQQKLVKASGLRAVREACGCSWSDVEEFVLSESMPIVVKPVESAGSDGVKLCRSVEDAEAHFNLLMASQKRWGSQDAAVLCQEFLQGTEYVVDHVSRDGVHKTMMLYKYDKRPVNGAQFVYYGMVPVPSSSEEAQVLIPYVRGVLDALAYANGPSHGEVMMTADGPCLVEMNCRLSGAGGSWVPLAKALTGGYSAVDATIDLFTSKAKFEALPDIFPSPFQAFGLVAYLVSMKEGEVKKTPGLNTIRSLSSFHSLMSPVKPGSSVELTVDLFTMCGTVVLLNSDSAELERDLSTIREMETKCSLFEFY